jgi:outer membrane lipoprotein-sorting protein
MSVRNILPILRLGFALLLLLTGCAARLPVGLPISQTEQDAVEAGFRHWQAGQPECPAQMDAAAVVTFRAWIQSGTLNGFVQAAEPSHLKFIALNPLGQPMLVLVTDGQWFRFVNVAEAAAYDGPVQAEAFSRYAPEGVNPEHAFVWLTGRLAPEVEEVIAVTREETAAAYWLDLAGEGRLRHRVLFDPRLAVLHRHQVVDRRDNVLLDVRYEDFQNIGAPGDALCRWPARITVETRRHRGRMIINLSDWLFPVLDQSDFSFEPPPGYQRILVQ